MSTTQPVVTSIDQITAKAKMDLIQFLEPWFGKKKGVAGSGGGLQYGGADPFYGPHNLGRFLHVETDNSDNLDPHLAGLGMYFISNNGTMQFQSSNAVVTDVASPIGIANGGVSYSITGGGQIGARNQGFNVDVEDDYNQGVNASINGANNQGWGVGVSGDHNAGASINLHGINAGILLRNGGTNDSGGVGVALEDHDLGVQIQTLSSGKLGFFNATPVTRPAAPTTIAEIVSALQALGLVA